MTVKKKLTSEKAKKPVAAEPITDTEWYKTKLEEMRSDLMNLINKKRDEVTPDEEVGDEADVAVRSVERDLVFEQTGTERRLLEEVEAALRRIEKRIYGICEANGEKITSARLKVIPYARYCIKCQSRFDSI